MSNIRCCILEQDAIVAMEAVKVAKSAKIREQEIAAAVAASSSAGLLAADRTTATDADTTFAANTTAATGVSSNKSGTVISKKKVAKAKLSAKEKKERSVRTHQRLLWLDFIPFTQLEIERIISCLPLEFRGSDPVSFSVN